LCHGNDSQSINRHITIRDCLARDVYVLNHSQHVIEDSHIISSASVALAVVGDKEQPDACRLEMRNVLLERTAHSDAAVVVTDGVLIARQSTFKGLADFSNLPGVTLDACTIDP
jgi:hypothetical protein